MCVLEKARSGSLRRLRAGARPPGDDRRCWLLCHRCTWAQLDISYDALDSRNDRAVRVARASSTCERAEPIRYTDPFCVSIV